MRSSVFLRPFLPSDLEKINKWRNDEDMQRMTCGRFRFVSLEIEKNWLNSKMSHNETEEYLAICLNDESKEMIGYWCLKNIDIYNRKCHSAGIVIDKEYQDGSYLIDANILKLHYVFVHLGMNRMTGACLETHWVSRIMMEAFGFELEGVEKESVYKHHTYHNVCRYALMYNKYKTMNSADDYTLSKIARRVRELRKKYLSSNV